MSTVAGLRRYLPLALVLTLVLSGGLALWDAAAPAAEVALPKVSLQPSRHPQPHAATQGRDGAPVPVPSQAPWPPVPRQALLAWAGTAAAEPAGLRRLMPTPATAPLPVPEPPPPAAPPAPYRYTGRITQDGLRRALLIGPQGTVVVAEQEALSGQWRVDRIADDALQLTWLPGGLPQRLPFAPT